MQAEEQDSHRRGAAPARRAALRLVRAYGWFVVAVLLGVRAVTGLSIDAAPISVGLLTATLLAIGLAVASTPLLGQQTHEQAERTVDLHD